MAKEHAIKVYGGSIVLRDMNPSRQMLSSKEFVFYCSLIFCLCNVLPFRTMSSIQCFYNVLPFRTMCITYCPSAQ
jgi:hypothetical protein